MAEIFTKCPVTGRVFKIGATVEGAIDNNIYVDVPVERAFCKTTHYVSNKDMFFEGGEK